MVDDGSDEVANVHSLPTLAIGRRASLSWRPRRSPHPRSVTLPDVGEGAKVNDLVRSRAEGRVGAVLRGKYTLERLLGIGSAGAVYAGRHRNGLGVAVKVLHPELGEIAEARRRFLKEGYIANRIEHPGVVRVLDDDEDGPLAFLAMEMLDGRTLADEWRSAGGKMSTRRVCIVAGEILDVLVAASRARVVHRDLKPDNVFLVEPNDRVKVLDFGIARLLDHPRSTPTGDAMGAAEFVAPEQARGHARDADQRADLYSLGAMMFTMLTGRYVHASTNPLERMILAATAPAPALRAVDPTMDEELAHVVDVALSFDRAQRWSSAAAMREALREVVD